MHAATLFEALPAMPVHRPKKGCRLADIRTAALTLIRHAGQNPRHAREGFAEQRWKAIRLVMRS